MNGKLWFGIDHLCTLSDTSAESTFSIMTIQHLVITFQGLIQTIFQSIYAANLILTIMLVG